MVADPDWEPAANFPYAALDFSHVAFMFKIWDRNAHTTRLSEVWEGYSSGKCGARPIIAA
jgi:hypothetical protein